MRKSFGENEIVTYAGGNTLGALNFGSDKVQLMERFAKHIIHIIESQVSTSSPDRRFPYWHLLFFQRKRYSDTVYHYEMIKRLKEEDAMTMSREIKELFRPEIEAEKSEAVKEATKETAIKLHQIGLSISQIIQAAMLPEDEILKS